MPRFQPVIQRISSIYLTPQRTLITRPPHRSTQKIFQITSFSQILLVQMVSRTNLRFHTYWIMGLFGAGDLAPRVRRGRFSEN